MQRWRWLGYLFIFLTMLPAIANAQGGYDTQPIIPDFNNRIMDTQVSFWQLPDWIKLFYVAAMATAFFAMLKAVPFVWGKIEDILENENRHSILNYIQDNPGSTIAQVSQARDIDRGTVRYHLYKLEAGGKIILSKMGRYSRIFRNSHTYSDFDRTVIAHLQNPTGRSILLMVMEEPGITNQELADRLGVEKSAIHWHVDRFLREGLVRYRQDAKFKRYFVGEDTRDLLKKYAGAIT